MTTKHGKTAQEFRETYDKDYIIPKRITEALKDLGAGWMTETEFCRHYQFSQGDFGRYKDQFMDNHTVKVESGKRLIWCGTKKFRDQLRDHGGE